MSLFWVKCSDLQSLLALNETLWQMKALMHNMWSKMRYSFLVIVASLKSKQQRINTTNFYLCDNSMYLVSAVSKHIDKTSLLIMFYWFDDINQCAHVSVSQMAHYWMIIPNRSLNFDGIFRNCLWKNQKYIYYVSNKQQKRKAQVGEVSPLLCM